MIYGPHQADHLSLVKTLYDYEASAPGELTIIEGEILLAFEPDDEWLLVQSTKEGGKAGYIPANYVETYVEGTEEEATEEQPANQRIIVPPSVRIQHPQQSCCILITVLAHPFSTLICRSCR